MIPFPFQTGGLGMIQAGPAAVTGWTPANLSVPPVLWFNDDSPISTVSGLCTQWNDISGNGYHFTNGISQPTVIPLGRNARRTIRFNSGTFLYNSSSPVLGLMRNTGAGWAAFVRKRLTLDGSPTTRNLFSVTNGTDGSSRFVVSGAMNLNTPALLARTADANSTAVLNAVTSSGLTWHAELYQVDWANGDGFIHLDGSLNASNTSFTPAGNTSNTDSIRAVVMGAYPNDSGSPPGIVNQCDSEIAEVIVGRGSLPTAGEITDLFGYFNRRWGV